MMQVSELQTDALVNQTATDLLEAAERLGLGNGGLDFHWHPGSHIFVAFDCPREAILFKLAYSGSGCWTLGHFTAPAGERTQLEAIIADHALTRCAVIEFVRAWLPSHQNHARLLAEPNKTGTASAMTW